MFSENSLEEIMSSLVENSNYVDMEASESLAKKVNYRDPKKKYSRGPLPPPNIPLGSYPSSGKHFFTGYPPGRSGSRVCASPRNRAIINRARRKYDRAHPNSE